MLCLLHALYVNTVSRHWSNVYRMAAS